MILASSAFYTSESSYQFSCVYRYTVKSQTLFKAQQMRRGIDPGVVAGLFPLVPATVITGQWKASPMRCATARTRSSVRSMAAG